MQQSHLAVGAIALCLGAAIGAGTSLFIDASAAPVARGKEVETDRVKAGAGQADAGVEPTTQEA